MHNPIRVNYGWERTHTGMLAYLTHLWAVSRSSTRNDLSDVLQAFGVGTQGTESLHPRMEYPLPHPRAQADLVVVDDQSRLVALFEVKVDGREGGPHRGSSLHETQRLKAAAQDHFSETEGTQLIYLTLGLSAITRKPREPAFHRVTPDDVVPALTHADLRDPWLLAWAEELDLERQFLTEPWRFEHQLSGRWRKLYSRVVLGHLARMLESAGLLPKSVESDIYSIGPRPDDILNFGAARWPLYMEVNYDGRLSLRANLVEARDPNGLWEEAFAEWSTAFSGAKRGSRPKLNARSATILTMPTGLSYDHDLAILRYPRDMESVGRTVGARLRAFYGQ